MRCPVCRADNTEATCRRCKADLTLVIRVEEEQRGEIAEAASLYRLGRFEEGRAHAEAAWSLRADAESARLVALGALYARKFDQALRFYRLAKGGVG